MEKVCGTIYYKIRKTIKIMNLLKKKFIRNIFKVALKQIA